MSSQWGSQKLLHGLVSHELTVYLSVFWPSFNSMNYSILSNGRKSDNFESHNSVKLSLTNIHDLHSNFTECESFLESNCPDILAICETLAIYVKLGWLNWFWQYLCAGLSSLDPKEFCYSYFWSCSLCEGRTSFCTGLISKKILQIVTYVFD